jgi:uncharacterized protein YybS (DUF2232 family)
MLHRVQDVMMFPVFLVLFTLISGLLSCSERFPWYGSAFLEILLAARRIALEPWLCKRYMIICSSDVLIFDAIEHVFIKICFMNTPFRRLVDRAGKILGVQSRVMVGPLRHAGC